MYHGVSCKEESSKFLLPFYFLFFIFFFLAESYNFLKLHFVSLNWCFSRGRAEKTIIPCWKVFGLFFVRVQKCQYLGNGENIAVASVVDDLLNQTADANWRRYVR